MRRIVSAVAARGGATFCSEFTVELGVDIAAEFVDGSFLLKI